MNELLFLCDDNKLMFKSDKLKIKDSEDFLSVLEQKLGSEEKILSKLESLFTSMKRNDILQIILAYKSEIWFCVSNSFKF